MEYNSYLYFMTYTGLYDTLWNHKAKSVTRSHTAYKIRYVCHGLRMKYINSRCRNNNINIFLNLITNSNMGYIGQ